MRQIEQRLAHFLLKWRTPFVECAKRSIIRVICQKKRIALAMRFF